MSKKNINYLRNKKILVTGGGGFLGGFIIEKLLGIGVGEENIQIPRSRDYDLRQRENCAKVVAEVDIVIHLAANVGGIGYNLKAPGAMFYDNITMSVHMMEEARLAGVEKFVALGTICAYPKFAPTPFREEGLWNGYPEETNAPYGLAKKMSLVQAQAYRDQYNFNAIYLLPVNLYGPRDNFDPGSSHVIPALIKKFLEAKEKRLKEVVVWGSGLPTREFLFVKDAAEAIIKATEEYNKRDPVNLGSGDEISIADLSKLIARLIGYKGKIVFDKTKPDGQPRRRLDTTRAKKEFGFKSHTPLEQGLIESINWYKRHAP